MKHSSSHTPVRTWRDHGNLWLFCLRAFTVIAWFNLALGLLILGYAAFAGPTWDLLRGGLVLTVPAVFVLTRMKAWRRTVET